MNKIEVGKQYQSPLHVIIVKEIKKCTINPRKMCIISTDGNYYCREELSTVGSD